MKDSDTLLKSKRFHELRTFLFEFKSLFILDTLPLFLVHVLVKHVVRLLSEYPVDELILDLLLPFHPLVSNVRE